MKRRFIVEVEIDEDPEMVFTKSKILEAIEEHVSLLTECRYDQYELEVSEEPLVSLEYLQSLDNTTPPHIQEIIDAGVLQDGIKTPDEIRKMI